MTADAISGSSPGPGPGPLARPLPLRLAILEADTLSGQVQERYGRYAGVFTALLTDAAKTLDPPQHLSQLVSITVHNISNDMHSYPPLDDVDAVLLTGSRHAAFDDDPWILKLVDYAKQAIESGRVRVVGVCFGHQIIGRAMSAEVGKSDNGWEIAVTEVELTDKGKEIFQLDKLRIHQMHRDVVLDFPKGSVPLARNDSCPVQGMYSPGRYITVQGHPEFTEQIVTELLVNRHKAGIFPDEVYGESMERACMPHDGVAIGRGFLNFMTEG